MACHEVLILTGGPLTASACKVRRPQGHQDAIKLQLQLLALCLLNAQDYLALTFFLIRQRLCLLSPSRNQAKDVNLRVVD